MRRLTAILLEPSLFCLSLERLIATELRGSRESGFFAGLRLSLDHGGAWVN
jgi:hypothetical protein